MSARPLQWARRRPFWPRCDFPIPHPSLESAQMSRLHLYTIPPHRAFADALASGLIAQFGGDALGLARGIVLVPSNRAKRAIQDAFVRASGGGLLLPRLVAVGDPELDEAVFDFADDGDPVAPAVDPLQRRVILPRLVGGARPGAGGGRG